VRIILLAAIATVALAPAAWCQPAPDEGAAPPAAEVPAPTRHNRRTDPNARRCISTNTVGSRLSRRVCHTNAEWEEIEGAATRQAAERGAGGPGFRCDGPADMCNGMGRTTVDGGGRSLGGGQ
jgi:hypothetical protein